MLVKVEVRNGAGEVLVLPLMDYSDGYTLGIVEGLDPVDAVLVYSSFAQQDGTDFQSAHRENRFITLPIGFEPNYALTNVKDLRRKLYKWFMPKAVIRLRFFEDDGLVVEIQGRVERNDSPRFTKDPDAKIYITCNVPDFAELSAITTGGNTTPGATTTDVEYAGTVETGFLFTMNVDRTISGFTMYNTPPDNSARSLIFGFPMLAGDVLKISTVSGNKYATLTRGGVDQSVVYGVAPASNWLNLFQGTNKLRVLLAGAVIPWTIQYTTKYGGL